MFMKHEDEAEPIENEPITVDFSGLDPAVLGDPTRLETMERMFRHVEVMEAVAANDARGEFRAVYEELHEDEYLDNEILKAALYIILPHARESAYVAVTGQVSKSYSAEVQTKLNKLLADRYGDAKGIREAGIKSTMELLDCLATMVRIINETHDHIEKERSQ